MGWDWVLEASGWAVAGVAAGAALAAWALYRVYHSEGGLKGSGRWALGALRFAALATIGVLLLAPLIRQITEEIERPVAVVLVDDSRSMVLDGDSAAVAAELQAWTDGMQAAFADRGVDAAVLRFAGEAVPEADDLTWSGDETDLGAALEAVKDRYAHRNVKGLVLVSDGRVNRGMDPEYGVEGLAGVPMWTVGVGDTTNRADRWVGEVACNRVAYLGNRFPLEAVVGFRGEAPVPVEVTVKHAGQIIARETWTPRTPESVTRLSWLLDATRIGTQRYEIACTIGEDERVVANNRAVVYVDVLERQKSVAIAARAPHPDLGWIIAALSAQEAYDVHVHYERIPHPDWRTHLAEADLIIAHDLLTESEWVQDILGASAPVWWLGTDAASLSAFSNLNLGASFTSRELSHRPFAAPTEGFTLFQWPDAAESAFRLEPPLVAPLGDWELSPAWSPALQVRLGDLVSDTPLMAFRNVSGERRWAFSVGSGYWRWRMSEGLRDEAAPVLTAWVTSTVQLLTSRSDVRRFRLNAPNRLASNDPFIASAEVYDAALNPLSGARVEMTLTTPEGNELSGVMAEDGGRYRIDWGRLPAGMYTWEASTTLEGELMRTGGEIAVEASALEYTADRADHGLLLRLAERSGGAFLGPLEQASPDAIADALIAQRGAQPVRYEEVQLRDAVELRWVLWVLVALLAVEWVFRRRTVGY